jgi:calcium permeable stress-gated cation channel
MFHELRAFVRIRQENLTAEDHRYTVRATTILVTTVPENFLNVKTLKQVFSVFPGGVRNVFLNRDFSELLKTIEERDKIAKMLESAETELIIKANKAARKRKVKGEKEIEKRHSHGDVEPEIDKSNNDGGRQEMNELEYLVDAYVPKKKRPAHRLPLASWMPSLPLIGKKVFISFL